MWESEKQSIFIKLYVLILFFMLMTLICWQSFIFLELDNEGSYKQIFLDTSSFLPVKVPRYHSIRCSNAYSIGGGNAEENPTG